MKFSNLTDEQIDNFIARVCEQSDLTDETKMHQVDKWVNNLLTDMAALNLLHDGKILIEDVDENRGIVFKLSPDWVSENPQYLPEDENPIWNEIAQILKDK